MSSPSIMSFESEFTSESLSPKKVVFPPPPPTTNRMSPQQRSQLRRSADKLRRVLGTTPRLIDSHRDEAHTPHHVQFPMNGRTNRMRPRASIDSISSIESSSSSDFAMSSCSDSTLLDSPPSTLRSKKSSGSPKKIESWPSKRPPMLRLSLTPSSLETIPASPAVPSPESQYRSFTAEKDEQTVFTMQAAPTSSFNDSPKAPTFSIMSPTTERRMKMERLRRKLGDEVPTHLVFPVADIDDLAEESSDSDYASSPSEPGSPSSGYSTPSSIESGRLPSPTVGRRRLSKKNTINGARDSIALTTPHKASRKSPGASRSPSPSPSSEFLPAAPTFLLSDSPASFVSDIRDNNDPLFVIMESPNEYGSSGDEKTETQSQASSNDSIWFDDDEEQDQLDEQFEIRDYEDTRQEEDEFDFQLQLWDIRRGYGGWTDEASYHKSR